MRRATLHYNHKARICIFRSGSSAVVPRRCVLRRRRCAVRELALRRRHQVVGREALLSDTDELRVGELVSVVVRVG